MKIRLLLIKIELLRNAGLSIVCLFQQIMDIYLGLYLSKRFCWGGLRMQNTRDLTKHQFQG